MTRRPGAVLVAAGLGLLAAWSAQAQPANTSDFQTIRRYLGFQVLYWE